MSKDGAWEDMQLLLQGELQRMTEKLSKDLRRDLSQHLAEWLPRRKPQARGEEMDLSPKMTMSPKSTGPEQVHFQLQATPSQATPSLNDQRDFARMRMKARTYVSTDGIGAPLPPSSTTWIGTPKSQPGVAKPGFGFSRSASMDASLSGSKIEEDADDEGAGDMATAGNKKTSRALREPRSIFVHHMNRFGPDAAGAADENDEDSEKQSLSWCGYLQHKCLWLVRLEAFDYVMGLAILANAILMGVQADLAVQSARTGASEPAIVRFVAVMLGFVFTLELVLRIFAYRMDFFTKPGWKWNVFDFTLVFLQLSEEVVTALVYTDSTSRSVNLSFMRVLRVLRLVRIVRLVRVLRLIRELRTLVQSIASTMTSLLWTVVLLLLLIFVVGICFTQVIADVATESTPGLLQEGSLAFESDTFEFYGSLLRSVMSLYQAITSGVSWRDAALPLERHSNIMGLIFAIYIAFAALAMLNVITGVFVESAMASAREENTVTVVSRMREIVDKMKIGESGQMTWEQFEGQLDNPVMEAYFRSIDLSVSEARSLFLLLDIDEQGFIDTEEFIAGCCRIHGPAKAIDLTTLMCQVRKLHMELREHALWVVDCMTTAGLATPAASVAGSPRRRPPSLTSNPEKALEEPQVKTSPHIQPSNKVELVESPMKLELPIKRVGDSFGSVKDWADSPKLRSGTGPRPLSL